MWERLPEGFVFLSTGFCISVQKNDYVMFTLSFNSGIDRKTEILFIKTVKDDSSFFSVVRLKIH